MNNKHHIIILLLSYKLGFSFAIPSDFSISRHYAPHFCLKEKEKAYSSSAFLTNSI